MMGERFMKIAHPLAPVFDSNSKILILGTMPSPKSREADFYYMHPQNKFWRVLCDLLGEPLPHTNDERRTLLLKRHIALWDVLAGCDIDGADDGSIRNPIANDLSIILDHTDIKAIFTTGTKATQLYKRLCLPKTGIPAAYLPSTSPANCRFYSYGDICEKYSVLVPFIIG
jgi:hypoxanthine-DNA glycosylase